jgi:hypothetical protein
MKEHINFKICIALILMFSFSAAYFYSGNDLAMLMKEYEKAAAGEDSEQIDWVLVREYTAYVLGVADATVDQYDVPEGVTVGQIFEIVADYLNDHPEEWCDSAAELVQRALRKAFPKE